MCLRRGIYHCIMIVEESARERKIGLDYEKFIDIYNKQDKFAVNGGVRLVKMQAGYAETEADIEDDLTSNFMGSLHGGFIFTMADVTAGAAAIGYGETCVTLDANIHFIRPFTSGKLHAIGRVIHKGRTTCICEVEIFSEAEKLISKCTCTMFPTGVKVEEQEAKYRQSHT